MISYHRCKRVLCFLLVFILAVMALSSVALAERRTVRVGFFAFDGYHTKDADGSLSGYGYEFLQHLSVYTNWKYEYIGYDKSWGEMQEMLAKGEIDMLTSAQKTEERTESFDFSDEPIGTSSAILTVNAGNEDYIPGDYSNWNGMRVGMISGNSRNADFEQLAVQDGFSYSSVYFDSTADMVEELKHGDSIDAIVTSNLRSISGESILAQFSPSPFYIMVKKGDASLLSEVNKALSRLYADEPELRTTLMNEYYSQTGGRAIPYTAEERAFIKSMQDTPLRAILNPDRAPYSYLENGKPAGMLYNVALEIISKSGLNVQFLDITDRKAYEALLESGDYDLRFDASPDYYEADRLNCRLSPEYMQTSISKLTLRGDAKLSSAGMLICGDIPRHFRNALIGGGLSLSYYNSTDELVQAVLSKECDAAYMYSSAADLAVELEPTNRLTAEKLYGYTTGYTLAMNAELDPMLYSILRKAVVSISSSDIDAFSQGYSAYSEQPFSLIRYTYDYPLHVILFVIGIFVFAGLVFIAIQLSRGRKHEAIRLEQERGRNAQLSVALKAAERADIAKNQFLSSMSHEIRTPLNAVIGFNTIARSEMAGAKTDADRRQADMRIMDYLGKSELASKHLLNIINDVLDMSAIESGKIKVAHEQFDFRSTVSALTSLFFSQAKAKGVRLEVLFDSPTEEWFVGDQMRINQILTNLLSNAVKFTPDGGSVKLSIVQHVVDEKSTGIHFEISDTGIGMTKEYLEHIWTPFEQAEASISRRFGGTGLGLSITKNLVELMGGEIRVQSESGLGTTFFVDLTLERMKQPVVTSSYDFSGIYALAVDDDVSTCDYIKLLFDRCGADCVTVNSGLAAVEAFRAAKDSGRPFTVCLVDWRMPHMDGLETVRRIHEIADKDIPIVIVTAYDFSEISDKAEEAGVNMFVSKPLFQSSLFDLLANISGRQAPQKIDKSTTHDFKGARVLLTEDNNMNMEVAKRILGSSGLKVDSAWNGREAIDIFLASKPGTYKAVLMDVHMPEMDGYEATRAIRSSAHPEAASIPIIAMTADAFAENIAQAYECGMNDHITKPIDIQALFEVLKKYIPNSI